jgi:hypothetical protein
MWQNRLEKTSPLGIESGRPDFVKIGNIEQLQDRFIISGNKWKQ